MIYLPSCHSTNDIAAELVRNNSFQEGLVVITDDQTKGRGQMGNTWLTEPRQNLTFSIILQPTFVRIQEQFLISKAISIGICGYLKSYTKNVKIKWPNDIYLGGEKVCGTLIENGIQGSRISSSIVGIGLNMNQKQFENSRATSLGLNQNSSFNLPEEFEKVIHHLDAAYFRLKSIAGRAFVDSEYLSLLYDYQVTRKFRVGGEIHIGSIAGVSETGKLRIIFEGQMEPTGFNTKEVEWVWDI